MELNDFAKQILEEPRLADKLRLPPFLSDHNQNIAAADNERGLGVEFPAREEEAEQHVAFPKHLRNREERARALHFFANHELLALELMALAVLKFPNLCPSFRKGLAGIMSDEIRHFELYHQRMQAMGLEFGELRANRFFWRKIAPIDDPLRFLATLSLTLEQANIDYARYYSLAFREVGDSATAEVLATIYQDEIRHVGHGVKWFERWRPGTEDFWSEYNAAVAGVLSPSHARGIGFDEAGRRAAAIPDAAIEQFRRFSRRRTYVPKTWIYNPDCEILAANPDHRELPRAMRAVVEDQQSMLLWLAADEDRVLCARSPSQHFLAQREVWPEVVTEQGAADGEYWGRPGPHLSKVWSTEWRTDVDPAQPGMVIRDAVSPIEEQTSHLGLPLMLKAAFAASGRGNLKVTDWSPKVLAWTRNTLRHQPIIAEPWFERLADFGVQAYADTGGARIVGVTRNFCDRRGQFLGQAVGKLWDFWPVSHRYGEQHREWLSTMREDALSMGEKLRLAGYQGPFSVDTFIDTQLRLRRVSEVNARWTMGHVAHRFRAKKNIAAPFLWLLLRPEHLETMGITNIAAWIHDDKSLFALNDVARASSTFAVAFVGSKWFKSPLIRDILLRQGAIKECSAVGSAD